MSPDEDDDLEAFLDEIAAARLAVDELDSAAADAADRREAVIAADDEYIAFLRSRREWEALHEGGQP